MEKVQELEEAPWVCRCGVAPFHVVSRGDEQSWIEFQDGTSRPASAVEVALWYELQQRDPVERCSFLVKCLPDSAIQEAVALLVQVPIKIDAETKEHLRTSVAKILHEAGGRPDVKVLIFDDGVTLDFLTEAVVKQTAAVVLRSEGVVSNGLIREVCEHGGEGVGFPPDTPLIILQNGNTLETLSERDKNELLKTWGHSHSDRELAQRVAQAVHDQLVRSLQAGPMRNSLNSLLRVRRAGW